MNRHALLMRGLVMAVFLPYIVIIVVVVVYKTADAFLFFFQRGG